MCGIVGYNGNRQAAVVLLDGLAKLEYRGYDSSGLAIRDNDHDIEVVKAKGRLNILREKTNDGKALIGDCGIGHTRWATHGEPSEINAHPHYSDDNNVIGVHNGIIENYQELKAKLERHGYTFYSSTDTEIAIKLIDYYYKKYEEGPIGAMRRAMMRIRGSYAFALLFKDYPLHIYVARKDSPLVLGINGNESFLASDVPAILKYTRNVVYIDNLELADVEKGKIKYFNIDGEEIEKKPTFIDWDEKAAEKNGFEHFMLKEIFEQPKAIEDTLHSFIKDENIDLDSKVFEDIDNITIVGCGSAYHVGVVGQYVIEDLAGIKTRVELASEFRYRKPLIDNKTLVIIISQSGETADSLAALRKAGELGAKTLGIVNVVGSSIAREADYVLYTLAGPEIAVATTKAYSCQLLIIYILALYLAFNNKRISNDELKKYLAELALIPAKLNKTLEDKERLQWFAAKFQNLQDAFFIGRGIDYASCLEGSLKMKEISYIHSEAYAAGELKHGTISLIEKNTLVIGLLTQNELYEKTLSNMVEVKSRGGYLVGITGYGNYSIEDTVDFTIYIPQCDPHFASILTVPSLQLLGYYMSVSRGLNPDKPRNLAKSVTVE